MNDSNDDIPPDEFEAAKRIAALCDGPVRELLVDAHDVDGSLSLELEFPPCPDLQAFADGKLDDDAAQELRDHLPECVPCSNRLLDMMQAKVARDSAAPTVLDGIDQSEPVHEDAALTQTIGDVGPAVDPDETQPMELSEVDGRFDGSDESGLTHNEIDNHRADGDCERG